MKIRLAAAAAAAIAAPILLPATHALASTTHVASPASVSHVSGGCGGGCGDFSGFLGADFHVFVKPLFIKPLVVPVVKPVFVPLFAKPVFAPLLSPCSGGGLGI
jgi:hypothetical protein